MFPQEAISKSRAIVRLSAKGVDWVDFSEINPPIQINRGGWFALKLHPNQPPWTEHWRFDIKINDFDIKIGNFDVKIVDFDVKINDFDIKICDSGVKTDDFDIKINDFDIKIADFDVNIVDFDVKIGYFDIKIDIEKCPISCKSTPRRVAFLQINPPS